MDLEIRPIEPSELEAFFDTLFSAFSNQPEAEDLLDRWTRLLEFDRTIAVFDEGRIVATAASFGYTMTIPGGELPTGGVTVVGVLPSHRRRGILRNMMRYQLDDLRSRGEPLAILWASEAIIYQRFGYGLGTMMTTLEVDKHQARFLEEHEPTGKVRLLGLDDAVKTLPAVYETVRVRTPGMVTRTEDWWRLHRLHDPKNEREGAGPMFRAVWEHEGTAQAYALYRVKEKWDEGGANGTLVLEELLATTPEATREMWRYIFSVDLVAKVKTWFRPEEDPLALMIAEPGRLRRRLHDGLWLRLVDVQRALSERAYSGSGSAVFEIHDDFCPWNRGVLRLDVSDGHGRVSTTSEKPDIVLSAADLAATYLGSVSFTHLALAGRVRGRTPGALERADGLFRTAIKPYSPEIF